ncbi:ribonuclease Y [Candidatus Falkowbacteria bacterium CG_4_9_14_3_um_filter_38_19]|uniref:Ribonuclease Y n=2 Tax=Bacteria candidate phyla TaxID=1783234 RepID=A0A2M8AHE6_9BACT|nr:ribonuclease Y [Candidatus Falkowbacteria bacterium]PIV46964.1 MAG: ribonuclease Y [bacterium (Candidatus Gribaldobacteria) CG02_land_8_20_14_3_00_41_15]PJB16986.1 MAG: ribonuclease Y [Candidatus Falkowbacteria bacterium CG_4_9_14_3_um_filter_38_19]
MEFVIYALLAAGGFFVGYWLRKKIALSQVARAEAKAEKILADTRAKQKELLLEAHDKALKIIDQAKKEDEKRRQEISNLQARLEKRETVFSQKLLELQEKQQQLYDKVNKVEEVKEKINKIKEEQLAKLEKIAAMTKEEAKEVLFKNVQNEIKDNLMARIKKMEKEASETMADKARDLIASAMQRLVSSYATEITTTTVDLPNDEMKGRIIGREGRNIKVIEQLTGVEIIVDDTPNAITISGFSPIRRHVAKRTLDHLIKDGRIHPTKIEDAIKQAKEELALDIKKTGEEALYEIGVAGFDPKLVQIIGRLKYRTSYGQNALGHSLEVAHLSALLAEELGADVTIAKKGGLLHDIGKAVDHEVQGTHPEIGANIAKKFNLPAEIIAPIQTHHDDRPDGLISIIVKVADAISAARPGARHDSFEQYIQRLEELEKIATSFAGVDKSYAIQAGREIRIFVKPEEIDDLTAYNLAKDIAQKIEQELKYPGEIKVNVIREMRVIEYAR